MPYGRIIGLRSRSFSAAAGPVQQIPGYFYFSVSLYYGVDGGNLDKIRKNADFTYNLAAVLTKYLCRIRRVNYI
jgi:hypothetical protein